MLNIYLHASTYICTAFNSQSWKTICSPALLFSIHRFHQRRTYSKGTLSPTIPSS